jgi:hypothetical protein
MFLGGIMNFRRPSWRPTKIHAQIFSSAIEADENKRQLFSWTTTGADENHVPIFVGHRGRRK